MPGKYETTEADISSTEQRASGIASTNLQHHDLSIPGREVVQNGVDISPEGPGSGHWRAGQAPEEMLAALTEFLAPCRENGGDSR